MCVYLCFHTVTEAATLAMNGKDRSSESLCETSVKMVTNIIKLSSFSVAKASLGTSTRPQSSRNLSLNVGDDSYVVGPEPPLPRFPGSRRSQESSKPISYLVEPGKGVGSAYLIHEEENVDSMASDYINKVHEKNRHYLREIAKDNPIILPARPRVVK